MKTRIALLLSLFYCIYTHAQFQDVSELLGTENIISGSVQMDGVSFYDFNQDGWDDISMASGTGDPIFLINNGGTFSPAPFVIPNASNGMISMLLWGDVNNDGYPDLLISKYGQSVELWMQQEDNTFQNFSVQSGIMQIPLMHTGAAFCDFNHDGCLDLYISKSYGQVSDPDYSHSSNLYIGNCDGTFEDVTVSSGVFLPQHPSFQPVFFDYDQDGWEDLLLIVDKFLWQNHLFKNNGDGTFTDVSNETGMGITVDAMSGTVGDYNHDGYFDVLITDSPPYGINLMQDDGTGFYNNVASGSGLNISHTGWGALWLDYDNNSWEDLYVTETSGNPNNPQGNHFFKNLGNEAFQNISETVGIWQDKIEGSNCAMGDFNNDGYYDIVVNAISPHYSRLYQNVSSENNYLSIKLQGTYSNRDAVGTLIECFANDKKYLRYTHCGENFISQNAQRKIFGLGMVNKVDSLKVHWNRGLVETYYDLDVNQHLHLIEGASVSVSFAVNSNSATEICSGDTIVLDAGLFESYLWSTGDTTQMIAVTESGIYSVECTNKYGFTITSDAVEVQVFSLSEVNVDVSHVSCTGANDGSITIEISTGVPQWIHWNNADTTTAIHDLSGGIYSFSAFDANGCPLSGTTVIAEPPPLLAQVTTSNVKCYGDSSGSAVIDIMGGTTPYDVEWFGADPESMAAGNYFVVVQDAHNCEILQEVAILQPDSLWAAMEITPAINGTGGAIEVIPQGGSPPYSIAWSTGQTNVFSISELVAGNYNFFVHDAHQCTYHADFAIQSVSGIQSGQRNLLRLFPNPAGHTTILEGCEPGSEIVIYDAMGRMVHQQFADRCPLVINLESLPVGTYLMNVHQNQNIHALRVVLARQF